MPFSLTRFLDHTQRHITVGRTPLDEWSARRRDLYLTTHNTHNRQRSMPQVGFKPTISEGERPQTYALDRKATGTGRLIYIYIWFHQYDDRLLGIGAIITVLTVIQWWRDVTREGTYQGLHTKIVTKGLRWGIILFNIEFIQNPPELAQNLNTSRCLSCRIPGSDYTEGCSRVSYQHLHHGHELGRASEIDRSTLLPVRDPDFTLITVWNDVILFRHYNIYTRLRLNPIK